MSDETTGAARSLPTVEVIHPSNPDKIIRINEADFNPAKHVNASARFRKVTPAEAAILDEIQAKYNAKQEALPESQRDRKDLEIEKLRLELAIMQAKAAAVAPAVEQQAPSKAAEPERSTGKKGGAKAEPQDALAGLKDL